MAEQFIIPSSISVPFDSVASRYFNDTSELDCNEELFVTSFYVSAITIGVTLLLVVSALVYRSLKFYQYRANKQPESPSDDDRIQTGDREVSLTPIKM